MTSSTVPASKYMLKVNYRNRKKLINMFKVKNKHQNDVTVFIVNFEHIPHLFLVFLLLILNM